MGERKYLKKQLPELSKTGKRSQPTYSNLCDVQAQGE